MAQLVRPGVAGMANGTEISVGSRRRPCAGTTATEKVIRRISMSNLAHPHTQQSTRSVKQLFDLRGRVALITGGSIGLGRQMAEGLAEMGANVALAARKKERCEQAAHDLEKLGVRVAALACDVKDS